VSDRDVKAFTVRPKGNPALSFVVTTATPVAKCPRTLRIVRESIAMRDTYQSTGAIVNSRVSGNEVINGAGRFVPTPRLCRDLAVEFWFRKEEVGNAIFVEAISFFWRRSTVNGPFLDITGGYLPGLLGKARPHILKVFTYMVVNM